MGVVEATPADAPRPLHGDLQEPRSIGSQAERRVRAVATSNADAYDMLLRLGAHEIELSGVEL